MPQKASFSSLILPRFSRDRLTWLGKAQWSMPRLFPLQELLIKLAGLRIGISGIGVNGAVRNCKFSEFRRRLRVQTSRVRSGCQPILSGVGALPAVDLCGDVDFTPFGVKRRILECCDLRKKGLHELRDATVAIGIFWPVVPYQYHTVCNCIDLLTDSDQVRIVIVGERCRQIFGGDILGEWNGNEMHAAVELQIRYQFGRFSGNISRGSDLAGI